MTKPFTIDIPPSYSRSGALAIVQSIGGRPERFAELMRIFSVADKREALRCIWIISMCAENHPSLIRPWLSSLVALAGKTTTDNAVKRNIVRTLQFVEIPKSLQGRVVNLCFAFLQDAAAPIAVKAFAMTVLANIARSVPELNQEIRLVIQQILPYGSAGIRARARKVLQQLSR